MIVKLITDIVPSDFDRSEILRYMNCKVENENISNLLNDSIEISKNVFTYRVCYSAFPCKIDGNHVDLGFTSTTSCDLSKNLSGCERIILFAASVGVGIDRLIRRYERISPAKAACLQAIGSERVEALCDAFNFKIKEQSLTNGYVPHPRFSCGYGDLSLELQKEIIPALDTKRKIGVSLTSGCLMLPTKSVTAIIGLEKVL